MGIKIVENKPPAATVSVQNQLRIPGCEQGGDFINHLFNNLLMVRGIGTPCRPALQFILKTGHHHSSVSYHPSQEPGLCAYMLDVIVPVIILFQLPPKSLFNGVAVWKSIEYQQHPVFLAESCHGGVDEHPGTCNGIFNYHLLFAEAPGEFELRQGLRDTRSSKCCQNHCQKESFHHHTRHIRKKERHPADAWL